MDKQTLMTKIIELVDEYCDQFKHSQSKDEEIPLDEDGEEEVNVYKDDDGDYVDGEGFIWDIDKEEKVGQKDPNTGEKTMFTSL